MVHCGSIRQTASIISMSAECLRTGDKATVLFRYILVSLSTSNQAYIDEFSHQIRITSPSNCLLKGISPKN